MVQTIKMSILVADLEKSLGCEPNTKEEICPAVQELFAHQAKLEKLKKLKEDIQDLTVVLNEYEQMLQSMKYDQEHPPLGQPIVPFHSQAIEETEKDVGFYETVIEDISNEYRTIYNELYIEPLRQQMNELYAKQKQHYEIQKERFETCKEKYGRNHTMFFPEKDQEFISNHRAANKAYMEQWSNLQMHVEMLNQQMEEEITNC